MSNFFDIGQPLRFQSWCPQIFCFGIWWYVYFQFLIKLRNMMKLKSWLQFKTLNFVINFPNHLKIYSIYVDVLVLGFHCLWFCFIFIIIFVIFIIIFITLIVLSVDDNVVVGFFVCLFTFSSLTCFRRSYKSIGEWRRWRSVC